MNLQACHKLYVQLDRVVDFNALTVNGIDRITLDSGDYKLFCEHNLVRSDGTYHYRNLLIRQKQVRK